MYKTVRAFPNQFAESLNILSKFNIDPLINRRIEAIHLAGMGGSALPADMVNDYAKENLINITRDYYLPPSVGEHSLVICSSYSGNTEETISALEDAILRKAQIVVMANGGKLKAKAQEQGLPFIQIPTCIQPRCASGHFFTSIVCLLDLLSLLPPQEAILRGVAEFLQRNLDDFEERATELAEGLKDRVPLIFGPSNLAGSTRIWKIKMNENAKVPSYFNVFPEVNHNEMVGYTQMIMDAAAIYLKTPLMHPRIGRRMKVMSRLLSKDMPTYTLELSGNSILHDIFESIVTSDFVTIELAGHYGIDPAPVHMVEQFKKKLDSETE